MNNQKPTKKKERVPMSNIYTDKFKEDQFENLLEEVQLKCFIGLDALGEPAFSKTDEEIEQEASELIK